MCTENKGCPQVLHSLVIVRFLLQFKVTDIRTMPSREKQFEFPHHAKHIEGEMS